MIQLIPDWKEAWKYASVQLTLLFAMLSEGIDYLGLFPQYLPPPWVKYAFLAILVGRLITVVKSK